jgi:serine/threonine protein kinase
MPVATPLTEVLEKETELAIVVDAVATFAETLIDLAGKGISHRDIKPGNLFRFQDKWVIGDFGIADYPEKEALTEQGKKLGPLHFMAPEMLENPDTADGNLADVYSLAKTLWVLAAGQNFLHPVSLDWTFRHSDSAHTSQLPRRDTWTDFSKTPPSMNLSKGLR